MNFFRKYKTHIIIAILGFFLFSIAVGFGTGLFGVKGAPTDTVVEVTGDKLSAKIPLYVFHQRYNRAVAQVGGDTRKDQSFQQAKQQEVIQELVQDVVFQNQADRFGIEVPDFQVVNSLAQIPAFQENGQFSQQAYGRVLSYQLRMTPAEFEEEQRHAIARFKLNWLIRSTIRLTDREFDMVYQQQGAEIAKSILKEKKAMKPDELRAQIHEQILQQKTMGAFQQWFKQLGERIQVKPHLDLLQQGTM